MSKLEGSSNADKNNPLMAETESLTVGMAMAFSMTFKFTESFCDLVFKKFKNVMAIPVRQRQLT